MHKIPTHSALSDLMGIAGPSTLLSGKIFLIRYTQDGQLVRKNIKFNPSHPHGSKNNPYLFSGDFLSVKNSLFRKTTGILKVITDPFVGIYSTKTLFDGLTN